MQNSWVAAGLFWKTVCLGCGFVVAATPQPERQTIPLAVNATPWGADAIRLQVASGRQPTQDDGTTPLLQRPPSPPLSCSPTPAIHDNLQVSCGADGARYFRRQSDGTLLLTETVEFGTVPLDGQSTPPLTVNWQVGGSTVFGLGQQRQTCYPEGGRQTPTNGRVFASGQTLTFDLAAGEGGAANTLPWFYGTTIGVGADWGLWVNIASTGNITLDSTDDNNRSITIFFDAASHLDYIVTTHPGAAPLSNRTFSLLERFTEWVGRSPGLPDWALGYWHSKNRYASQQELLTAAHGFANRSIPVDIIVIDWMHWKVQGDWHFDPSFWPDPTAMVRELKGLGMEVMVTVWPFSFNGSRSFDKLNSSGWLVQSISNRPAPVYEPDGLHGGLVDPTQQAAREYVWSMIKDGYYQHGIRVFWLDASEPEYYEMPAWGRVAGRDATFKDRTFSEIGQMFTWFWVQTMHEGLKAAGETSSVMLPRAGYAGTWRFGAGLWSGDIHCNFDTLAGQVQTALSAQTSGFGLWTSDIGGYSAGPGGNCDATNISYREVIVRWFQFGVTSPIFRQHGQRDTEVWLFGTDAEAAITAIIRWRASKKAYLTTEMNKLRDSGRPINRPLWWDFPHDPHTWSCNSTFMFGDQYLVSPVVGPGIRQQEVYLPCPSTTSSCQWRHEWTGDLYNGNNLHMIDTPLAHFPLFERLFE